MSGTTRGLEIAVIVLLTVTMGREAAAGEAARDDSYLRGYAAAILEREFHVTGSAVSVWQGVVRVAGETLGALDRREVIGALSPIPGVIRVEVIGPGALPAPAAPAGTPEASPAEAGTGEESAPPGLPVGWLPEGHLFGPLLADPRWPHFSAAYHRYLGDHQFRDVGAVSFGETIPFYRLNVPVGGQLEVGLQAGVFAIFNLDADSKDLINADYTVAATSAYRSGPSRCWRASSIRARTSAMSSSCTAVCRG